MARWSWWHQKTGPDDYRIRELLRGIWDLHAMFGADRPWLWRGQADAQYRLEPGIHTRVSIHGTLSDDEVVRYTKGLLDAARRARLDVHEGTALPDLALLALLQHHGAATPLLDVTLDPMVALYMAVVSQNPDVDDSKDGALFAIRRPEDSFADLDSRPFDDVYKTLLGRQTHAYSAPDVSERLRIQRGHFLLGAVSNQDPRVTFPLSIDPARPVESSWIWKRMQSRGKSGKIPPATTDIAVFRITAKFKLAIANWLEDRTGLTKDFVYPTAWHQPYLERFATSHGRLTNY